ncbi:symplekin [Loa loa]|uniref:Symplekin n=1 Tax=Loa loa TaxID=7209 RepID=A0A1S0UAW9_LOALO|nr:symplekin [Loa loa]EFO27641.2 symplekin [Loa loa]
MTDSENTSEEIGNEIHEAHQSSGKSVDIRIKHLYRAQELLLHRDKSSSLLDNFLDEMLEFVVENDSKMRCFVASFIEKACKKDCEVMKKAVVSLSYLIQAAGVGTVSVIKKVITVCSQLYPLILKWAAGSRSVEVARCWEAFSVLKGRIMQHIDSDNEGIRTQTIRFLEAVILAQTLRTEESEKGRGDNMCLNEIGRDHRFISYRKMESEATLNFNSLLDHTSSAHISSLNLLTCLTCICNIAQQRPQFMQRVVGALEALHVNLPPTLATSQVKSVRKELKMHLLRLLRHPSSIPFHPRIMILLTDLGAAQSEVLRALPSASEQRKKSHRNNESSDEPETKRMKGVEEIPAVAEKEDDEDEDEAGPSVSMEKSQTQSAVDITAQFVYERLKPKLVTNLVLTSLVTLPDEMPAAFQSSYTPIAAAGTESQIRHLSRMIATQLTSMELGPGVEKIRTERQQFIARQTGRMEGAVILPTPSHQFTSVQQNQTQQSESVLSAKTKPKIQFGLLSITKELDREQSLKLILLAFKRILANEKRAIQGGVGVAQQKLLVRLVTRFNHDSCAEFEDLLMNFIVQEQKSRTELALLWIAELYAQFQGYSLCRTSYATEEYRGESLRYKRYDAVLCNLLKTLFERGEHKETLFHKILLEAPLLTPQSLVWLRTACLDSVFGAFGMTTLRELILTRARQRNELLCILLDFSYSDRADVRTQSIETAKELYQIDYVRGDVREYLISSINCCTKSVPPSQLYAYEKESVKSLWNDAAIRITLNLFLSILPLDHSLIHTLAAVYAKSSNDIKRVTLRTIDSAIKSMGAASEHLLEMIENCPQGAETFAARIVHLLTERNPPTQDLVNRITALYEQGRTDVRSMIPVLSGLDKDQILSILPKFVVTPVNQKSVPVVFNKLLAGRNIKTGLHPMGAGELLMALHKIHVENKEENNLLLQNIDVLLTQLTASKDAIGSAIDQLCDDGIFSETLFYTVTRSHKIFPALGGFISNVLVKIANKNHGRTIQIYGPILYAVLLQMLHIPTLQY